MPRRGSTQNQHTRLAIAQSSDVVRVAARLISEGQTDYETAKRKAARQLGLSPHDLLPDNHEIDEALRTHYGLFASEHDAELNALRLTALRAMDALAAFEPWLVGPVLSGTANKHSVIELEVVGIDEKSFETFLLNRNVDFDTVESRQPTNAKCYSFVFENTDIDVTVHNDHAARMRAVPKSSVRFERVQCDEAEARFIEKTAKL